MVKYLLVQQLVDADVASYAHTFSPYRRQTLKHRKYRKHTDRHGFPHRCMYCSKRFTKPSQLQRHLRIHTGERPYQCNLCKKTFSQKGSLQLHEKTHDELRPFKCDLCPMRFAQKGNLRSHVAVSYCLSSRSSFATRSVDVIK